MKSQLWRKRPSGLAGLVLAIVALTIAISWILLPAREELGLIDAEAGRIDRASERLEAVIATGNTSPEGVAALARARLNSADVEGALVLLEQLARKQPEDPNLQMEIARIYQGLEVPEKEIQALAGNASLRSRERVQRRLADLFELTDDRVKARRALEVVIALKKADGDDYRRLARLYAEDGLIETAVHVLSVAVDTPDGTGVLEMLGEELQMRLSIGGPDGLAERISTVLTRNKASVMQVRSLLSQVTAWGYPDLVVDVLSQGQYGSSVELMKLHIEALSKMQRRGDALAALNRLMELANKGDLATRLTALDCAVSLEAWPQVKQVIETVGLTQVPSSRIGAAAAAAINLKGVAFARSVVDAIEKQQPWVDPIVVAELHLVAGLFQEARAQAVAAENSIGFDTARALYLVDLFLRLKMRGEAGDLLEQAFARSSDTLTWERSLAVNSADDAAYLFLRLGRAEAGYRVLARLREVTGDPSYDGAWALLAAASDRPNAVKKWLTSDGSSELPETYLRDLRSLASQAGAKSLAIRLAKIVAHKSGTDRDKLSWAGEIIGYR